MSFDPVLGQEFAVGTLRRALKSGRLHHAYRFEGPDGVGKEKTALALAQALVCERSQGGEGCGACVSCRRAVTFSKDPPCVPQNPDVLLLECGLYNAIGIEEKQFLSVAQIRKVLLERLLVPPHGGRGRIVLIRQADEMNQQAANALLKTLEEPPARTHFVLLTSKPRMMLDTIRSRAIPLRFSPLRSGVMKQILSAHRIDASEQLLELAGGSVSAALAFSNAEETEARHQFVEGVRRAIQAPSASEAMALAQARDKEKDTLKERLAVLAITFAREAREHELSGEPSRAVPEWVRFVLGAIRELDRNVAPALVMETMLLRMRAA